MLRRTAEAARQTALLNMRAAAEFIGSMPPSFQESAARLREHTAESFAESLHHRDPPYASYTDLVDEAIERGLIDVFGST